MKQQAKTKFLPNINKTNLIAGISLLVMAVLAGYANFGILQRLEKGDDTPYNFSNNIGSVKLAIACLLLVAILDVIVALCLYRLFVPVHRRLSQWAAGFRVVYAVTFTIAIFQLVRIVTARDGDAYTQYLQDYRASYLFGIQNHLNAFHTIWDAGLIMFGLHLLIISYLILKADFMPRLLGIFVGVAALGYLVDSIGRLYIAGYNLEVTAVTFVGEVFLLFWLLLKGRRLAKVK